LSFKASGSVLGANVNVLQPTFDGQYYHASPRWHKNVLAFHLTATTVRGYGGKDAPPFLRSYIGGENDVRGFDFYSIAPIAYLPSTATINQLNPDGSQRYQNVIVGGVKQSVAVTLPIPIYQLITPGGDTHGVFNFEYRIPIMGPITLVPFLDAGINRIMYRNQLEVNPGQITNLDNQFPQADFSNQVKIAPGTQALRTSTGLELDVILPVVQAPFRIYYAYNPTVVREYLQPPIVLDRSTFPNTATFTNALASYGTAYPFFEKRGTFRFTIGRTF
jgi:outer membrane protein insertion porin family